MRHKNVITWKDADQNLCHLAALMFENALQELRPPRDMTNPWPMDNGKDVEPGYAEEDGSKRTVFTDAPSINTFIPQDEEIERPKEGSIEITDEYSYYFDAARPSSICWWSFQNLIRWRLRKARLELSKNLYGARKFKNETEKNASRNLKKRPEQSKYGRQAERD